MAKQIRVTINVVYNEDTIPRDMTERLECNIRAAVHAGLLQDKDQEAVIERWEVKSWELAEPEEPADAD